MLISTFREALSNYLFNISLANNGSVFGFHIESMTENIHDAGSAFVALYGALLVANRNQWRYGINNAP